MNYHMIIYHIINSLLIWDYIFNIIVIYSYEGFQTFYFSIFFIFNRCIYNLACDKTSTTLFNQIY